MSSKEQFMSWVLHTFFLRARS